MKKEIIDYLSEDFRYLATKRGALEIIGKVKVRDICDAYRIVIKYLKSKSMKSK